MIKKHHWLLHLGESYRKHKMMVACWTMERKHRFISRIGSAIANARHLEQSGMEEVVAKELHTLGSDTTFAKLEYQLQKPSKLPKKLAGPVKHLWPLVDLQLVTTSKTAWLKHGASCSAGDVVLVASAGSSKWACGKIHLHLAFAGQCFALMSLFSLLEVGESFAIWQDSAGDGEISAVAMRDILTPLVYNSSAGKVTTLIPLPWR
jgi:hypothetical protein